ncbi:hypothetical protein EDD38_6958 [Kitasatospora cineracea]|uniref:site-specific DNA-methyltransferase (adenine-specific) n=1 Tax=Kitasatospora cineracea TaxID=88074 RepID=A0A3N4R3B7_9ACTN|nr:hypothetical protein EDD38_6958 [Kitasatospora cineracea]
MLLSGSTIRGGTLYYNCDRCGYIHHHTGAQDQHGLPCRACGSGRLLRGRPDRGYLLTDTFHAEPHNLPATGYRPVPTGQMDTPGDFNYFSGVAGQPFLEFVRRRTCYVGRFTNLLVPQADRFGWLSPYTGNKHNRSHFTQLVLAHVARAKFADNRGRLPRLIEPFVGSGQIFLNSSCWGPAINDGIPLFRSVLAGDLNHYVVVAYRLMQQHGHSFVTGYVKQAASWDHLAQAQIYPQLIADLREGRELLTDPDANPAHVLKTVFKYIWLVNRCVRGTKLTDTGGLVGTPKGLSEDQLDELRERERTRLGAVVAQVLAVDFSVEWQDFRLTCAEAEPTDVVVLDCPFPAFTTLVPPLGHPSPETFHTQAAHTYGVGDDGAALQQAILKAAADLVANGTTVVLCNFANPGLVRAYSELVQNGVATEDLKYFTYTYRSPSTTSEAYQLTILPGLGNANVTRVPATLLPAWLACGGDDLAQQEFFAPRQRALTAADLAYQDAHDASEEERQNGGSDYEMSLED